MHIQGLRRDEKKMGIRRYIEFEKDNIMRIIFIIAMVLAIAIPAFAKEQKKPKDIPYLLVNQTYIPRGSFKVVSVSYFPSVNTCLQALKIIQKETARQKLNIPDVVCQRLAP